jgi:NTE family protein
MRLFNARHFTAITTMLLSVFGIAACMSVSDKPPSPLSPRTLEDVQRSSHVAAVRSGKPAVALVLGGGGLRGFAHLGVLRAFDEAGIQPDIVVGTSAGAVVGAAYASGMSAAEIETIGREVRISSLIDFTFSKSGLMRGDNIADWVNSITSHVPIEAFPRRFAAVATDLDSGKAMLLDRGFAGLAVQASAAVPGPNVPIAYKGGHLVDGGIASLVPVRFARAMGAHLVIAVDIYCTGPGGSSLAAPSVLLRVMRVQSCMLAAPEMAEADILIAPAVSVAGMSAKDDHEQAIAAGYEAAVRALAGYKSLTERKTQRPVVEAPALITARLKPSLVQTQRNGSAIGRLAD